MIFLTKAQRLALRAVHQRHARDTNYREFRRKVTPLLGDQSCVLVPVPGFWVGIELDGYTHT